MTADNSHHCLQFTTYKLHTKLETQRTLKCITISGNKFNIVILQQILNKKRRNNKPETATSYIQK